MLLFQYVLTIAILDGSLMGSVLSVNRLDFWPPPTAAMALSIAASTIIYEKQFYGCSRIVFICAAFVPGIMFCLLYGLIMGNLFDIRFLLWVGVLIGEAYVDIQVPFLKILFFYVTCKYVLCYFSWNLVVFVISFLLMLPIKRWVWVYSHLGCTRWLEHILLPTRTIQNLWMLNCLKSDETCDNFHLFSFVLMILLFYIISPFNKND